MNSLWRILLVLALACFCVQGVFAHEHAAHATNTSIVTDTAHAQPHSSTASRAAAHCLDKAGTGSPCSRDDSICCMTACGVHCAALFMTFRFEPAVAPGRISRPLSEASHEGITRAPPLRPPIA